MKTRLSRIVFLILTACFFVFIQDVYAKNLYVAPGGSDSVAYASNDISHPWLTWNKAVSNAQAGDIVYFRAGTYTISSTIDMNTLGYNGSSGSPVTFSNYPGEKVVTTTTASVMFYWDKLYHQVTADAQGNMEFDGVAWVFYIGNNGDGSGAVIKNCKIYANSTGDNYAAINLQANRSNNALIEYNEIIGPQANASKWSNGIIYLGGTNTGTRILNNNIHETQNAIYIKHSNSDTSSSGAEIGWNYIYNSTSGVYGQPQYINIHDNLLYGCDIDLGDCGGGSAQCQGSYDTINHNTVTSGMDWYSPGLPDCTIKNNIFSTIGGVLSGQVTDYNMYTSHAAIGSHDLGNTSPTYVGGSDPIAKYTLTSGSAGHAAGSDGKDMGADISHVGSGASQQTTNTTPPATPTGVTVTIIQ